MDISRKSYFVIIMICDFQDIFCLSGHVCTRERAENYLTSYNQAFLCQERYTTSCGHLDWRRCTRYRVQTCYTPNQRYMTRYHQVEECCSGWREDGSGRCTVPACSRVCANGGTCVAMGNMPGCLCQEGFYGDICEHANNEWKLWYTVAIMTGAVIVIIVLCVFVVISCRTKDTRGYYRLPTREFVSIKSLKDISTYTAAQTTYDNTLPEVSHTTNRAYPSAPDLDQIPPD